MIELATNERLDDLMYRGRKIIQNTEEFCFSLDAVLLAHFPRLKKRDKVLDLGTGTGVIPLLIAGSVEQVDAIEINPTMAKLAQRNVILNSLEEHIRIIEGDYREHREQKLYKAESYDMVFVNPPYYPVEAGKSSEVPGKRIARSELTATLDDCIKAARFALRFGGRLVMVHIPERLGEIICTLNKHQLNVKRLQFIQPKLNHAPNMLLLEAVVGAKAGGMRVEAPLIVHEDSGEYTPTIKDIYGIANEYE